ncbi:hypothetical protein SY26_10510 [Paracoccus sp. 228]|nr:hypothetical protein SY26_10510 [Paracoccus sp. 228]
MFQSEATDELADLRVLGAVGRPVIQFVTFWMMSHCNSRLRVLVRRRTIGNVRIGDPSFQWVYDIRRAKPRITLPPSPSSLNGAEESVEMVGARIVAQVIGGDDVEAVSRWRRVTKSMKQTMASLPLIGILLAARIVLVATATDKLAGQNARIGLNDDTLRITGMEVRDGHA